MESFIIEGGKTLRGSFRPSGNKNAAIAALAASLLTAEPVTLQNIPRVGDVQSIIGLMRQIGAQISDIGENEWQIKADRVTSSTLEGAVIREVSSAVLLMTPILARTGSVVLSKEHLRPTIIRRLHLHLDVLERFGVRIQSNSETFVLSTERLQGADILLEEMSVSSTEQAIFAAVLAEGETVIHNAASEPHVQDVCRFLNALGADISGIGSNRLLIRGVPSLGGGKYRVGPDYVEIASLIAIAAITNSELRIVDAQPKDHRMNRLVFNQLGIDWRVEGEDIIVLPEQPLRMTNDLEHGVQKVDCEPWPGFATDLVSVAVVVATQSTGECLFNEKMYGNRFYFVDKLIDMGASIVLCDPYRVLVKGRTKLQGIDPIVSPDVRAGIALVAAALCASGRTVIHNVRQIDRGFERIEERLAELGANILRRY